MEDVVNAASCGVRFLVSRSRPSGSSLLPVSANSTVPNLTTSRDNREQRQERKLNIPADQRECVCVRSAGSLNN